MFLPIYIFFRLIRAIRTVVALVRDRELAGQLPWPYFRHVLATNRWIQWQAAGLLSILVVYPITALTVQAVVPYTLLVWFSSLFSKPIRGLVVRRRRPR